MLADLSIIPVGGSSHTSDTLAEALEVIHASGLAYQLTPTTTCVEGSWDEINGIARRCHELARRRHAHVVTLLRIEDDADVDTEARLAKNIESVAEKTDAHLSTRPGGSIGKRRVRNHPGRAATLPAPAEPDLVFARAPSVAGDDMDGTDVSTIATARAAT